MGLRTQLYKNGTIPKAASSTNEKRESDTETNACNYTVHGTKIVNKNSLPQQQRSADFFNHFTA